MTVAFLGLRHSTLPVACKVKESGQDVVVLDVDPDALFKIPVDLRDMVRSIDKFLVVPGWDDTNALRSLITAEVGKTIAGVYTNLDEACPAAAELRAWIGFQTTRPSVIRRIIHKLELRRELIRLGRSKLRIVEGEALARLTEWPFPGRVAFLKNVLGAGGFGVRGLGGLAALPAALAELQQGPADTLSLTRFMQESRGRMLEEAAEGTLVSFEAAVQGGRCYPFGFTLPLQLDANLEGREPRLMPGCVHPFRFPGMERVTAFLANTLAELTFSDGLVHIEAMVDDEGNCEIIDLNPRFIGAHCLWAFNAAHDLPVEGVLTDWALGRLDGTSIPGSSRVACLQYFLGPKGGTRIESIELPAVPKVAWSARLKDRGHQLPADPTAGGWVGAYIAVGEDQATAQERARELRADVRINGRPSAVF